MKKTNLLLLFLFTLLIGSCKEPGNSKEKQEPILAPKTEKHLTEKQILDQKTPTPIEKSYSSCEEFITALVKSSNASAFKSFDDVQIRIEEITSEKIVIELYVSNNTSEDPSVKEMTDHAVGWLEFFPASEKLQDITADPEEPQILKYNHSILGQKEALALCGFTKK